MLLCDSNKVYLPHKFIIESVQIKQFTILEKFVVTEGGVTDPEHIYIDKGNRGL